MKIRDSGMPNQQIWESFFDASLILHRLAFSSSTEDVADFGCGYGTFSIAAAQLTSGRVHALDIDPEMIAATAGKARSLGLPNVRAVQRDFATEGTGLPDDSIAYAMLFNVLHAEDAIGLLCVHTSGTRAQHPATSRTMQRLGTAGWLRIRGVTDSAAAIPLWSGRAKAYG
jgi:SAM-dependent methyltransferase